MGSGLATLVEGLRWEDPNFTKHPEEYNKFTGYALSKYANTAFTAGLVKHLGPKGVLAFCLRPGSK